MVYFLALFTVAISPFAVYEFLKRRKRRRLLATPLSNEQSAILHRAVPFIRLLPPQLWAPLNGKISRFLDQVDFVGCEGLEVTEEMRLSIAAQASVLIVASDMWYENLRTVLIYPSAFKSRTQSRSGYVVQERDTIRLGESWGHGRVVLSWQHSEQGAADPHDGQNVVFHEFAHQIDDLSGQTNGVPMLADGQSFAEWERVMLTAFNTHAEKVNRGHKTVLDAYGATAHEEFFAVAVELFFERPEDLKADEPAVYEQLSKLFQLDPEDW